MPSRPEPTLDATDRRLVRATQAGLPLVPRPYHAIAEQLGLNVSTVKTRAYRARAYLRRRLAVMKAA